MAFGLRRWKHQLSRLSRVLYFTFYGGHISFTGVIFHVQILNFKISEFHAKCFCKVAAGLDLPDSTERILRIEGRDASLGLAARRIATGLTKDLKDSAIELKDESLILYQPRGWDDSESQIVYLNGRMDPTPGLKLKSKKFGLKSQNFQTKSGLTVLQQLLAVNVCS